MLAEIIDSSERGHKVTESSRDDSYAHHIDRSSQQPFNCNHGSCKATSTDFDRGTDREKRTREECCKQSMLILRFSRFTSPAHLLYASLAEILDQGRATAIGFRTSTERSGREKKA